MEEIDSLGTSASRGPFSSLSPRFISPLDEWWSPHWTLALLYRPRRLIFLSLFIIPYQWIFLSSDIYIIYKRESRSPKNVVSFLNFSYFFRRSGFLPLTLSTGPKWAIDNFLLCVSESSRPASRSSLTSARYGTVSSKDFCPLSLFMMIKFFYPFVAEIEDDGNLERTKGIWLAGSFCVFFLYVNGKRATGRACIPRYETLRCGDVSIYHRRDKCTRVEFLHSLPPNSPTSFYFGGKCKTHTRFRHCSSIPSCCCCCVLASILLSATKVSLVVANQSRMAVKLGHFLLLSSAFLFYFIFKFSFIIWETTWIVHSARSVGYRSFETWTDFWLWFKDRLVYITRESYLHRKSCPTRLYRKRLRQ